MKKSRNRRVEYRVNEIETAVPKNLSGTVSCLNRKDVLQRLHGAVGVQPIGTQPEAPEKLEGQVLKGTTKHLDGQRVWVQAEVGGFGWRDGYNGYRENRILLKNVKFRDSGRLFKERLWLTCGVWTEGLQIGTTIAFEARLANGGLKNPTNVMLIEPGPGQGNGTHGARQTLMF